MENLHYGGGYSHPFFCCEDKESQWKQGHSSPLQPRGPSWNWSTVGSLQHADKLIWTCTIWWLHFDRYIYPSPLSFVRNELLLTHVTLVHRKVITACNAIKHSVLRVWCGCMWHTYKYCMRETKEASKQTHKASWKQFQGLSSPVIARTQFKTSRNDLH